MVRFGAKKVEISPPFLLADFAYFPHLLKIAFAKSYRLT